MKSFSRLAQKLEEKRRRRAAAPGRRRLPRWVLALLCLVLSAGATFALFEYFLLSSIPPLMQGKWVVVEGELEGATLEFFRDGTMVGTVKTDGKEGTIKGTVEVEGNSMKVKTGSSQGNLEVTEAQNILDLTESQLVVQDSRGEILKMKRIH